MINIHLEALNDLIDKFKETMNNARDLYTYQKSISDQVKNLGNIQKQLSAYEGDTSEETRATVQKLRDDLQKAQDQLKETEWDKYISETEQFLSDMYDDYSEVLNQRLDDVSQLVSDLIDDINERSAEISSTVREVSNDVAYKLTENVKTFLANTPNQLVSDFKTSFTTYATATQSVLAEIKKYVTQISQNTVKEAVSTAKVTTPTPSASATSTAAKTTTTTAKTTTTATPAKTTTTSAPKSTQGDGKPNVGDRVTFASGKYTADSYGGGRSGSVSLGGEVYITKINPSGTRPYHISRGSTLHNGDLGWVTLSQLRGYATGSKNILSDQLAWTNENDNELIYRTTDGAILTPLNRGDKVFTSEMSDNLWELAKNGVRTPVPTSTFNRTVNNNNAISITLPNVSNYEQFKEQLKKDSNMAKFIQEITLGEATHGVILNKRKL